MTAPRPAVTSRTRAAALFAALFATCLAACAPPPDPSGVPAAPAATSAPVDESDSAPATRAMLLDSGAVYFQACSICHGKNGRGGRGPAVANSDYAMADRARLVRTVLAGVREPIHVNGVRWKTGEMLGWAELWPDFRIAAVLTYIRAALNDTLMTDCVPEDMEAGTWASCTATPRAPEDIAADSIAVHEVTAIRRALNLPPAKNPPSPSPALRERERERGDTTSKNRHLGGEGED